MENWWEGLRDEKKFALFSEGIGGIENASRQWIRNFIIANYDNKSLKFCDLGCGIAREKEGFDKYNMTNVDYTGIDSCDFFINRNKQQFSEGNYLLSDITNTPFKDNEFDIVLCRHIFEHQENYLPVFKEAYRLADKMLIIVFFNLSDELEYDTDDKLDNIIYNKKLSKIKFESILRENEMDFNSCPVTSNETIYTVLKK